jgi:two-component system response regulator MtrA
VARVLIADDEEPIRDLIKEVLATEGHEFLLAENGSKALELLRAKGADLAIIDRNMPGMSGIDVVKVIRANPKFDKVRILMCTAASITSEIDEAFNAGADDYVLKPLNLQALLGKVAKALAKA